jgi:hypothetical protein
MTEDQNPSDGGCFSGDERLEPFPLIGRLIRKGHPAQLAIPDADRVRVALNAGNGELAAGYLSIIRANCEGMVFVYGEFIPAFADVLERRTPRLDFLPSLRRAHQRFERLTGERETFRGHPETAQVLDAFHPRRVSPRMVTELREGLVKGLPGFIGEMVRPPSTAIDSTLKAIGTGHYDEALSTFERYYASMRRLHDLLVEFVSPRSASFMARPLPKGCSMRPSRPASSTKACGQRYEACLTRRPRHSSQIICAVTSPGRPARAPSPSSTSPTAID